MGDLATVEPGWTPGAREFLEKKKQAHVGAERVELLHVFLLLTVERLVIERIIVGGSNEEEEQTQDIDLEYDSFPFPHCLGFQPTEMALDTASLDLLGWYPASSTCYLVKLPLPQDSSSFSEGARRRSRLTALETWGLDWWGILSPTGSDRLEGLACSQAVCMLHTQICRVSVPVPVPLNGRQVALALLACSALESARLPH